MYSTRFAELVQRLDKLPDTPTLLQVSKILSEARLELSDVAPFVRASEQSYNRSIVVQRDNYELLVLTWTPGQQSAPHDHSGSVSAMQVLAGNATESFWRVSEDGYADIEFESELSTGQSTAWHDAGVHSIGNASPVENLVTIHLYAPRLREFRRYRPRPKSARPNLRLLKDQPTVTIVGGGFSGSMTAAQLLRQANLASFPLHVILVERTGTVGEGVAYGTQEDVHLLNVPSGRMSAWADKPDDFASWVEHRYGVDDRAAFVPRKWFGEYVRETLLKTANERGGTAKLTILFDEVRRLSERSDERWLISFKKGTSVSCDSVVLAIGHRTPSDPIGQNWSGPRTRYIQDPWQPFAVNSVAPDQTVVVLGTGLTALDTTLALSKTTRSAPIILLSRRGLLPQVHSPIPITPISMDSVSEICSSGKLRLNSLSKLVRNCVRSTVAKGGDWRSVVDGLRPHTALIWQSLSVSDRKRFLRHLRPFWEIHRHRTASGIAERFQALAEESKVKILSGRVSACHANEDNVRLFIRERGHERLLEINSNWVINCTGPSAPNDEESNPVIGSLLINGSIRADPLSLGLETDVSGCAIDVDGNPTPNLHIIGTLRKPNLWETTAVPELRVQASQAAESILNRLNPQMASTAAYSWSI